jgi:hypothetical protein
MTIPNDSNSLLVPVQLDAWVVDPSMQQKMAWYYSQYSKLSVFKSPMPDAYDVSDVSKPAAGIHLHWSLPDALTHGKKNGDDPNAKFKFPLVPNRWMVVRLDANSAQWKAKVWVVKSDSLGLTIGTLAKTIASGTTITALPLTNGATRNVPKGTVLKMTDIKDALNSIKVTVASDVKAGDKTININSFKLTSAFNANSNISTVASSSFLDPNSTTYMKVPDPTLPNSNTIDVSPTDVTVQNASIGNSYSIDAWEATPDNGGGSFLTAVGAGNVAFAAYVPGVRDVFAFTDTDPNLTPTTQASYTYLVTGWYASPGDADPMRGVNTFMSEVWSTQAQWQAQNAKARFDTLLGYYKWTVGGNDGATPQTPATSLYHGLIANVQWPFRKQGPDGFEPKDLRVAIASTSTDALAAMFRFEGQKQGTPAGDTLAQLMQAAMYDMLNEYTKPGSSAMIRQKIHEASFGSKPGGISWEVISNIPESSGQDAGTPALTPAQKAALTNQLAALNASQHQLNEATLKLESMQAELYAAWLKMGIGKAPEMNKIKNRPDTDPDWSDLVTLMGNTIYPTLFQDTWTQYCAVATLKAKLPDSTNEAGMITWADANWSFTGTGTTTLKLSQLFLKLKANTNQRFWHPNDPVMMISGANRSQKHGGDGRYNSDGKLPCRLPGQTITGVTIPGTGAINVQTIGGKVNLAPYGPYNSIPAIPSLIKEAFFVDPANAKLMAGAVGGNAGAIATAITNLLQGTGPALWVGPAPVPFSIQFWQQAWIPLYLEWQVNYYSTSTVDDDGNRTFNTEDWTFDGEKYNWTPQGKFDSTNYKTFKGRTILTSQSPLLFKDKIASFLSSHAGVDSQQLENLIGTVSNWDILSQSLSGFTDQLITMISQETFPPPVDNMQVTCPPGGTPVPTPSALIGDQYQSMPMLTTTDRTTFYPFRGGFISFGDCRIVDAYGQTLQLNKSTGTQGFVPIIGQGLMPTTPIKGFAGMIQLAPRVIQGAKLDMRILSNDGSGGDILTSTNPNPVCGWLLPNHLNSGIAVYDGDGVALGELLPLQAPFNWRPRPGTPGTNPPPAQPANIPNQTLRAVVSTMAAQNNQVFTDMLKVIDETLWMVDPMGGRRDQMLSVLLGRPLALVQVDVSLDLHGNAVYSQYWNKMAVEDETAPTGFRWTKDTGGITDISLPVRLGSLDLPHDGLIGYFLGDTANNFKNFYSVHYGSDILSSDTFIKQILDPAAGTYNGDLKLAIGGPAVRVTMLIDPRGQLHAYSGVLPVTSVALPGNLVEDFIRKLKVTFQTGPVVADPGTLRMPQPAENNALWMWIQSTGAGTNWTEEAIVDADDKARMPEGPLQLKEGWLQLSGLEGNSGQVNFK